LAATGETLYLNAGGVMSERLIGSGGTTQWTDYLFAGGEMVGMRVEHSASGVLFAGARPARHALFPQGSSSRDPKSAQRFSAKSSAGK